MQWIDDKEVGPLWAEHYPRCKDNDVSMTLCVRISHLTRNKAQLLESGKGEEKLSRTLEELGIPSHEFYDFEQWWINRARSVWFGNDPRGHSEVTTTQNKRGVR